MLSVVVAPRAGAWIETRYQECFRPIDSVAPRAGAWIETFNAFIVCELRLVAPRAGAWIETLADAVLITSAQGLPLVRGRGLKLK